MKHQNARPLGKKKRRGLRRLIAGVAGSVLALSGAAIATAPAAQAVGCQGTIFATAGTTGGSGTLQIGCVPGPSDPTFMNFKVTVGNTPITTNTAGTWTEDGSSNGTWSYDYSCFQAGMAVSAVGNGGSPIATYPSPLTIPDNGPLPASCTLFTDVPPGTQFYSEISWLSTAGISTGWDEAGGTKTFRPLQSVNRDAMAAFLYRNAGSPAFTPPATSPFTDVPTSNQFYKEITWLAATGISTGWDEGNGTKTFRPLTPVARDAMAAFLYRSVGHYAPLPPGQVFADVSPGSQFAYEMNWLYYMGITSGWEEGNGTRTYRPLQSVNRDAMAAFMYRLHSAIPQ